MLAVALLLVAADPQPPPADAPPPPATEPQAPAAQPSPKGLEARVRALCDQVAIPLKRLPGDYREQHFAVVPFDEAGPEVKDRHLGAVVGDIVVTDLARDHHLQLVERAALAKILDEQALGQSGAIDEKQSVQLGKIAGARALVLGQISDAGDSFRVAVRAVDVETGSVIDGSAHDVALPKDELIAFSANAVVLKSKSGAMFRSILAPGWGQAYNGDGAKAVVFGVAGYGGLLTTAALGVGGILEQTHYSDTSYFDKLAASSPDKASTEAVDTRNTFTALYTSTAIAGGLTALAWSIGALDAYLSGTDVENLDAALARN
jgi:TolB-like protein